MTHETTESTEMTWKDLKEHLQAEAPFFSGNYEGDFDLVRIAFGPDRITIDGMVSLNDLRALVDRLEKEINSTR